MKQEIIRKLSAAVAMSLVVGVSLAACGGSSSSTAAGVTKTGSAEGFGGAVTATLTVDANGTVTDCKLEGAQETESIGGAALEELSKQVVAANGPAIDGVAGATVTSKAVRKAVAAALGVELAEEAPADSAAAAPAEPAAIVPVEGGIQIGQAYAAAHGTKCFTEAVAVVKDDVILAAYLDDFQFTSTDAGVTAVPNSDSDFAAGYAEGKVLMSKRANADYYSKMMAEKGGSTVALDANFDAIQNFAVGKTISELEDVAAKGAEAVDAVSGATLVDTAGYLSAIVDAAKNAQTTQAVEFNGSSEDLKLNVVYGAAHGTKCFTSGAVATAGDTIVLSYIDEFQFAGSDAGVVGVPNSDSDFGAGYAEGKVLMSKRVNADYYSKMMAEKAGSTVSLDANYDAIQNHVNGMSIADAEALSKDEKAVPVGGWWGLLGGVVVGGGGGGGGGRKSVRCGTGEHLGGPRRECLPGSWRSGVVGRRRGHPHLCGGVPGPMGPAARGPNTRGGAGEPRGAFSSLFSIYSPLLSPPNRSILVMRSAAFFSSSPCSLMNQSSICMVRKSLTSYAAA